MQTRILNIQGMTCQSCANRIEKVLNKKDFIKHAEVSFAGETARITFDEQHTDITELIGIIGKTGFQAALPSENPPPENHTRSEYPLWRVLLLLALSAPFLPGMFAMLAGSHAFMPPLWLQIALATIAQCWLAWPFYRRALAALRSGSANMDVLVSVGTLSIYLYSLGMAWTGHGGHQVYFEAGVMILAFVSLGKFWEERTKHSSLNSLSLLLQLTPRETEMWRNESWQTVALTEVQAGDTLRTVHGGRIAADGTVTAGEAWADESHLTGESRPIAKRKGDKVLAGALLSGSLEYRADALGSATLLGDMMNALSEAQNSKAPIARLADKTAAVFVPAVMLAALLTFAVTWWVADSAGQALVHAVAVLVVACPCALGLATPAAVMAGMGVAVRNGIWFKNAAALERAGSVDTVVLDKTGTLTEGKPRIAAVHTVGNWQPQDLLQLAASVEQHSLHPLATALLRAAEEQNLPLLPTDNAVTEAGQGIRADAAGIGTVSVGSMDFCRFRLPENLAEPTLWQQSSIVAVCVNGQPAGAFALSDMPKRDSAAVIKHLQQQGMHVVMMSGDRQSTAEYIGTQLDIKDIRGGMNPRDKAEAVRRLMAQGHTVAMTGDGINDTAALTAADIGIAVHGSSAAASHSADIELMRPSLRQLNDALTIARTTLRHIKQNLFFAFIYNIIGIPLAAFGLLTPALAGGMMALSSVSVLLNALRLKTLELPESVIK